MRELSSTIKIKTHKRTSPIGAEFVEIFAKVDDREAMCKIESKKGEGFSVDCVGDNELLKRVVKLKIFKETVGEFPEDLLG